MNHDSLTPRHLAREEIRRRPWQFVLSVCAVAVGVAVVGGCLVALARERRAAEATLRGQERDVETRFGQYRAELAEAMTKAGFHLVILPAEQDLGDWHNEDFAAASLPPDAIARLAARPFGTIEHLQVALVGRLQWPERKWTVLVRGHLADALHPSELASRHLGQSVPDGCVDVGEEIARAFSLAPGQELGVAGRTFRVHRCRPATGTKDDITLHLPIAAARDLLGRPGATNEILALEKPTAWGDIERVRAELAARLPEARVFEIGNRVVANMRSRRMAERESRALLEQERQRLGRLLAAHGRLAAIAALATLAVSSLWLAVMTFLNLARRRGEIGLLSALGVPPSGIRAVFLVRIVWVAALGLVLGAAPWLPHGLGLGAAAGALWLAAVVVAALPPLLATVAVLHGQLRRHDPADVLKNEV